MDTNDLQDRASKLLRALEDGDANKARDMLHGEDALEIMTSIAYRFIPFGERRRTVSELWDILAAERMARDVLKRTTSEQIVNMAAGMSGSARISAENAIAFERCKQAKLDNMRAEIERYKYTPDPSAEPAREDALEAEIAHQVAREPWVRWVGNPHGIVRDLAQLDHGRAVADLYASDEDVEARR